MKKVNLITTGAISTLLVTSVSFGHSLEIDFDATPVVEHHMAGLAYSSVREMVSAADVVVVGSPRRVISRFGYIKPDKEGYFPGDPGDLLTGVVFDVVDVLHGSESIKNNIVTVAVRSALVDSKNGKIRARIFNPSLSHLQKPNGRFKPLNGANGISDRRYVLFLTKNDYWTTDRPSYLLSHPLGLVGLTNSDLLVFGGDGNAPIESTKKPDNRTKSTAINIKLGDLR